MPSAVLFLVKVTICTDSFLFSANLQCVLLSYLLTLVNVVVLTQASFHSYVRTWSFGHAYTYSDICAETISASTSWIPDVLIILSYMTICTLDAWEIQRYTSALIRVLWPNAPEILSSPWVL
jgi:hypothetical protein